MFPGCGKDDGEYHLYDLEVEECDKFYVETFGNPVGLPQDDKFVD